MKEDYISGYQEGIKGSMRLVTIIAEKRKDMSCDDKMKWIIAAMRIYLEPEIIIKGKNHG